MHTAKLLIRWIWIAMACFCQNAYGASQLPISSSHSNTISPFNPSNIKESKPKPPLLVQKAVVMIDPGHGGHDVGTQSISKPRYLEKSLNLATAQFVKSYLEQLGYKVLMTREEDKFVSLDKRAQIANEKKPVIFVSIHYNSAPSADAQGIEVFYYQSLEDKIRTAKSKKLAQVILRSAVDNTKANSRGVKQGNYAVIRETKMPAVLIEGGFVTNESEMQKLKDPEYLRRLAWGISRGIEEYLDKSK